MSLLKPSIRPYMPASAKRADGSMAHYVVRTRTNGYVCECDTQLEARARAVELNALMTRFRVGGWQ